MLLSESTINHQSALAAYCRTGTYTPIPGVREDHVQHYRRLVYNVIDDTLRSAYPLTANLLTPKEWERTVNRFFREHPNQNPQVWRMPEEFYHWIIGHRPAVVKKYPFLGELIWFEWLEVELFMMADKPASFHRGGTLRQDKLILNPEHHLQAFSYPVHLKNAKLITPSDQGSYLLVLHRDPASGKVHFTNLSPLPAMIIEWLSDQPLTLPELLERISAEVGIPTDKQFEDQVVQFLEHALENALLLGFD